MMTAADRTPMIKRYLLGDMSGGEGERIEEDYFVSDDRFGELLEAEDDLVDSFLHNRLGPRDRRLFEGKFLASERGRGKVALAALIEKTVAPSRLTSGSRWLRPLAIAAVLVLMALSAGLLRVVVELRQQVDQLVRNQSALRTAKPPRQVFSIVLASAERGSGAPSTIILPGGGETAELLLLIPRDEDPAYGVSVQTIEGRTLWSERGLRSRAVDSRKAVVARIPSSALAPGTYVVSVVGEKVDGSSEPIEDFSFTVRRP